MELIVEIGVASVSVLTVDCHGSYFVIQNKMRTRGREVKGERRRRQMANADHRRLVAGPGSTKLGTGGRVAGCWGAAGKQPYRPRSFLIQSMRQIAVVGYCSADYRISRFRIQHLAVSRQRLPCSE